MCTELQAPGSPLDQSLASLSRSFVGDGTTQETFHRVAELTVEAVAPAEFAGISLPVEGRQRTGDGPCLDSFRHGKVNAVESTLEDGPWGAFREACAGHRSSAPCRSPSSRAFSDDDREVAERFAAQAAVVMASSQAYWDARSLERPPR